MDDKLLGDADEQRLATSQGTIQSRYSKKYLGKSPGLSVYTLVTNFVAPNAKNIGLNEYKGHSLIPIIGTYKGTIRSNAAFFASSSVRCHVFSFLLSTRAE